MKTQHAFASAIVLVTPAVCRAQDLIAHDPSHVFYAHRVDMPPQIPPLSIEAHPADHRVITCALLSSNDLWTWGLVPGPITHGAWSNFDRGRSNSAAFNCELYGRGVLPRRLIAGTGWSEGVSLSVMHAITTPEDLTRSIPSDRRWAGVLLGEVGAFATNGSSLWHITLRAGEIGPMAYGREVQTQVHEWTGSARPSWEDEVTNHFLIDLGVSYFWRHDLVRTSHFAFTSVANFGASLGLYRTHFTGGGQLRLTVGRDSAPWGARHADVTEMPGMLTPGTSPSAFGVTAYVGVQGTGVVWDATLDLPSASGRQGVTREAFTTDIVLGLESQLGPIGLSASMTHRSPEFTTQREAQWWGSLALKVSVE